MDFLTVLLIANATPLQMGVAVSIIVALMGAILLGIKLKKEIVPADAKVSEVKLSQSPLSVELVKTMVTKDEMEAHYREVKQDFDSVRAEIQRERLASRAELSKAHDRINKYSENMAEIKGSLAQLGPIKESLQLLINNQLNKSKK